MSSSNSISGAQLGVSSLNKTSDVGVTMPEAAASLSFEEIQQAWNAYNQSDVAHAVRQLEYAFSKSQKLSQWEIDVLEKTFKKFEAQYLSPLAKGLK